MWVVNLIIFILFYHMTGNAALAIFWTLFAMYFLYLFKWMAKDRSVFSMLLILLGLSWLFGDD